MNAVQSNIAPIENKKKLELSRQDQELLNKAKLLSRDPFIPDTHRGNVPACFSAIRMSNKFNMDPMSVMQSMYFIHGKMGFSSTFIIACINASGRFTPLRFEFAGEGDDRSCIAYCRDKESNEMLKSVRVSIAMAKKEGWAGKRGSKWDTMPDLMLQYRSATFFGRAYAPDYLMGVHTKEEIQDISDTPKYVHKVNTTEVNTIKDIEEMEEKQIDFNNDNEDRE